MTRGPMLWSGLLLALACGKEDGGAPAAGGEPPPAGGETAPAPAVKSGGPYPDTAQGLEQLVRDAVAAAADPAKDREMSESLRLPDSQAWFTSVFGDEVGKLAEAEYQVLVGRGGRITSVIARTVGGGASVIKVSKSESSDAPDAARDERKALMAMKKKVPLYRVELLRPGEDLGTSVHSFVHVGGTFRFVGRIRVE